MSPREVGLAVARTSGGGEGWRERLGAFLEHPACDIGLLVLILVSVGLILAESMLSPENPALSWVVWTGDAITLLFAVELTLRFLVTPSWRLYLRRYWMDVLSIIPLLRVVRVLRVLRLLRVFRAGLLLNRRISIFSGGFRDSAGELVLVLVLLLIIVLGGALGVHILEDGGGVGGSFSSFGQSFWWSFLSFMAGEPVGGMPETVAGKLLTVVVMTGGMVVFAMLTGVFSAALVHRVREQMKHRDSEIEHLRDHVVVCGWNRAGLRILDEFQHDRRFRSRRVVIVCEREEPPELGKQLRDRSHIFFLNGDYTRVDVLLRAGVNRASAFILLADKSMPRSDQDRDARTVLAAMLIEKKNPDAFTCVELLNRENGAHLRELGVEEIVVLDDYGASIIAAASQNQGMVSVFDELFTNAYGNRFCKIEAGREHVGRTVGELIPVLKAEMDAIFVALDSPAGGRRREQTVNPPSDRVVREGERLILIATEAP